MAWSRALATAGITQVPSFSDPFAAGLLPSPWVGFYRAMVWLSRLRRDSPRNIWWWMGGMVDHVPLRSLAIDEQWRLAHGLGLRQLVILGAGLDARAYRLSDLSDVEVFEVDHPSTQAHKKEKVAALSCQAAGLRYVGVDFAVDDLAQALRGAGLRLDEPTFWIWEGVTMYLPPAVTLQTLATLAELSAPGSRVVITYLPPVEQQQAGMKLLRAVVGLLGEPFVGEFAQGEFALAAAEHGFSVVTDTDLPQWAGRFSLEPPPGLRWFTERMVALERSGTG